MAIRFPTIGPRTSSTTSPARASLSRASTNELMRLRWVQGAALTGSSDPTDPDTDGDGMPDGWEVWFARWDVLRDDFTLNPLNASDAWGTPMRMGT